MMGIDWSPLFAAPWYIQLHAIAALAAIPLGAIQFAGPKGTRPHMVLGTIWVVLMIAVTVSSAFILGPPVEGASFLARLSFIHVFTVATAIGIVSGVGLLLRGGPALRRHYRPFLAIYIGGLLIAGAFTLLPGRIMHEVFIG